MRKKTASFLVVACMSSLLLLFACGGGGGGGGSSSGISYSGVTTPVALTQDNAQQIMEEAVLGGITGSGIVSPFSAAGATRVNGGKIPFIRQFTVLVRDLPSRAAADQDVAFDPSMSAIITETLNEHGSCGGTVSGSLQVNEDTGTAAGSITFSSYCEMGFVMNGRIAINGNVDPYTEDLDLTMTFSNFTEVSDEMDLNTSLSGSIRMVSTEYSDNITMNMYLRDNSTGDTFWLNNYQIESFYSYDYEEEEMEISGRFYSSDYGYVSLSTEESIRYYFDDDFPSDGILVATGAAGTSARLTVLSSSTYMVEVDADGDGVYEWDSGALWWDS